jgi:4-amino-4-deoxy-L-arabinose transferase-like glycosyltransferase
VIGACSRKLSAEIVAKRSTTARYLSPAILSGALILVVTCWLAFQIPKGAIVQADELRTAERSREMLLKGPWTVYSNFAPSFAKPPLQYWLTAMTLPRFANPAIAVRVWPLLYTIFAAAAVGWLAFLVDPTRSWLILLAVAIFISSPLILMEGCRGLLDVGLTFFTTLAIALAQLARVRPGWWLGVAIACWLGTIQKIPLIFLIWLIIVLMRLRHPGDRILLRSRWLKASVILALVMTAIWPSIQFVHYHMPLARAFVGDDFNELLLMAELTEKPSIDIAWMIAGWLMLAGGVFLWRGRFHGPVMELSLVLLATAGLFLILNLRSIRYFLPILPALSILLALLFHRALTQKGKGRTLALVLLLFFVSSGFVYGRMRINHRMQNEFDEQQLAQKLGSLQDEATTTLLIKSSNLLFDRFYLFYGRLHFPLQKKTLEQLRQAPIPPPVIGICSTEDFFELQKIYPQARIEQTSDKSVCWRAGKL